MSVPAAGKAAIHQLPAIAYKRIVVKAGTNVLTKRTPKLSAEVMSNLVGQIGAVRRIGAQVILVTSGAIAAGREALGAPHDGKAVPIRQMLAAVGQSRLMHTYQELFSRDATVVAQALLTRHDVEDRVGYLNVRRTLDGLLNANVVPIVNENDVVDTEEIGQERFGDNDTLSALVANLIDADLLIMLTDTGGLYTTDPNRDPNARLIPRVERIDASIMALAEAHRSTVSRGGMASKLQAAKRATASGVTVVIAAGTESDVVTRVAAGEPVGTLFLPTATHVEARKRWLLSGISQGTGQLVVDQGAAKALCSQHRSLLPAGVRGVRGAFLRGDVVGIITADGEQVACGICNYDADDLRQIAGVRSDQILARLGHHYGDEAVHRDNLVLL
ncbi:MAG: glutamate 5-kinase [SAR202 cluster bacterium]|nr:glutamate 5-kinase [SAR202 cluster bacterium]